MSDQIETFLATYSPDMIEIAKAARKLVISLLPEAVEQIDEPAQMLAYGYDATYKGLICVIAPHKAHVNLGFARGFELDDPEKLLEGTGKRARHVKLKSVADLERPAVTELIKEAAQATRKAMS